MECLVVTCAVPVAPTHSDIIMVVEFVVSMDYLNLIWQWRWIAGIVDSEDRVHKELA